MRPISVPRRSLASGSIQTRLLIIALVPSLAALLVGVGLSGYLIQQGLSVQGFVGRLADAKEPTARFLANVQDERQQSLVYLSGRGDRAALEQARQRTDGSVSEMDRVAAGFAEAVPDDAAAQIDGFRTKLGALRGVRQQVDSRPPELEPVYNFYNQLVDSYNMSFRVYIRYAPDAQVSYESNVASDLLDAADAMARGHALALGRTSVGMTPQQYHEYAHQIGAFHDNLNSLKPRMTPQERQDYASLLKGPAWKRVDAVQSAIEVAGGQGASQVITVPVSPAEWISASHDLAQELNALSTSHFGYAVELGATVADQTMLVSVLTGVVIVLLAATVFLVALRLSQLLIRRLTRLRRETLDLAEREMPAMLARLREGKHVDVEHEVSWLDFGGDEIGQVASAFNKAHGTAIRSTVLEAETRQGVRSVFLNIAHRSQVMVHRQLKVLDQAQSKLEDPDQLEMLFQLDHLATQSRRNAENLVILGGQRPGRQWRNPVPLHDVVQGAVAETELYARVDIGAVPEVSVHGRAVADLVHLLAELVDNATSFSPPESHVEVRGNVVGKGVIVEVEDQGIGLEPERFEELNAMLADPPDFSVMALSEEVRLGLFVVAQLAARHEFRVSLRDSAYGGVRAVVMIPTDVIAESGGSQDEPDSEPAQASRPAGDGGGILGAGLTPADRPAPSRNHLTAGRFEPGVLSEPRVPRDPGAWREPKAPSEPVGQMPNLPKTPEQRSPKRTTTYRPRTNGAAASNQASPTNGADTPPPRTGPPVVNNGADTPPPRTGPPVVNNGVTPAGAVDKPPLPRRRRGQQANLAAPLRAQLNRSEPEQPATPTAQPRSPERFRTSMTAFQSGTRQARTSDTATRPGGNER